MKNNKKWTDPGFMLIEALEAYYKNYNQPIDTSKIYWVKFNNISNAWEMTEENRNGR